MIHKLDDYRPRTGPVHIPPTEPPLDPWEAPMRAARRAWHSLLGLVVVIAMLCTAAFYLGMVR